MDLSKYKTPEKTKIKSERSAVLKEFLDKLTPEWKGKKPLTPSYLGMRLSHLKTPELYYLLSACKEYERRGQPFSKCFWGSLKTNG